MLRNVTLIMTATALWAGAQAPAVPVLAYPADGAKDFSVYGTLKWKKAAGATAYHVQVAIDLGFTDFFLNDSAVADTSVKMPRLSDSTNYYWRVRGAGASGFGAFSKTRLFTTTPPLDLGPVLTAPPDYAGDIPTSVDLVWDAFAGATGYHVQVSTTTNFADILKEDTVAGTTFKVTGLEEAKEYFWHVRAMGPTLPGQKTAWTKARFLTAGGVAVRPAAAAVIPSLSTRALPGGGVEIAFDMRSAGSARLTVADWSGRVLEHRALGRRDAGLRRAAALQGRPAGVYLVKVEAEGRRLSARVVLP